MAKALFAFKEMINDYRRGLSSVARDDPEPINLRTD